MSFKKPVENPKPPLQICLKTEDGFIPKNIWECGECGTYHAGGEHFAFECCKLGKCKMCGVCTDYSYKTRCRACENKYLIEKAVEVKDEDGWVCEIDSDNFYESMGELWDHYEDNPESRPVWVHPCKKETWNGIDIEDILENCLDNFDEDARDRIVDYEELENFLKSWNAKQDIVSYYPETNKKIRVYDPYLKNED